MENGGLTANHWRFKRNEELTNASALTVRSVLKVVADSLNATDSRRVIPLGHGDPSVFPAFRTTTSAEDAICSAVRSGKFNGYSSTVGLPAARSAIADYLSKDLPYKLSADDVFLTIGCCQGLETIIAVLSRPNCNILLPRPGYPYYEARARFSHLEVRYFDLIPDKGWEVDLDAVEALADENTVAIGIINPGNPCGNVFEYEHLKKVAQTAKKLGILVISDEVYDHLTFGPNPFVPMGVFGSIVPVVTIGSLSKRWVVPGWRIGWLVTNDPEGILLKQGIVDSIKGYLNITPDPATFAQGALPEILEKTPKDFFLKILNVLRDCTDILYDRIKEIPCLTCPSKPEGSMFVMVKLNLSALEGIEDDMKFCRILAGEESIIVLPGVAVGLKNWIRITFACEPSVLEDALGRLKAFSHRHAKKQ